MNLSGNQSTSNESVLWLSWTFPLKVYLTRIKNKLDSLIKISKLFYQQPIYTLTNYFLNFFFFSFEFLVNGQWFQSESADWKREINLFECFLLLGLIVYESQLCWIWLFEVNCYFQSQFTLLHTKYLAYHFLITI